MKRFLGAFTAIALIAAFAPTLTSASDEPDELLGAKILVVKAGKLFKFVAKGTFTLPASFNDPTVEGGTLQLFDTVPFPGGGAGNHTFNLAAGGWTALGSNGFKYKGSNVGDNVCKIVLLKTKVIKAVCKGTPSDIPFVTPFNGPAGVILTAGTDSKRYCFTFGGTEKKNDSKLTKRKDAAAPGSCPALAATPTATNTGTATLTRTATNTRTNTPTATDTRTATNTPTVTETRTATNTATATNTRTATNTATNTRTATATATITVTFTPTVCPIGPGKYTVTQASGGVLKVYSFAPFPFPAGGQIVEDVSAAPDASCVHNVVVPFPGGFSAPNFCVPALGFTTSVTQTACGIGKIDSNGGSDFDTNEIGDTSNTNGTCSAQGPHTACATGGDNKMRVDITVGNGSADVCSSGTANALVVVPVHTKSWSDNSGGTFNGCPGDGVFNAGDTTQADFDQILDFTTASAAAHWQDIDGDLCSLAGLGPAGGHTGNSLCTGPGAPAPCCTGNATGTCPTAPTGICMNLGAGTVSTVAQGQFASTTPGVGDGSFATYLPNTVTGPAAPLGATCAMPPAINFTGTATRCLP